MVLYICYNSNNKSQKKRFLIGKLILIFIMDTIKNQLIFIESFKSSKLKIIIFSYILDYAILD